jgi:hypothetical protein
MMRQFLLFILSFLILSSAMGISPSARTCRMAKGTKSKECPCAPKAGKKKCCQPKLKPQKHLAQKNQKSPSLSERFFLPLSPIISPFLYFFKGNPETDSSSAYQDEKPPDKQVPIYILQQNFRC